MNSLNLSFFIAVVCFLRGDYSGLCYSVDPVCALVMGSRCAPLKETKFLRRSNLGVRAKMKSETIFQKLPISVGSKKCKSLLKPKSG